MAANSEWHYAKGNQQFGPVSTTELRQLTSAGKLFASDLVWKEGWEDWREAGTIKGLFESVPSAKSGPPALPRPADSSSPPSPNISDAVKSDLNDLVTSAKRAKDFAFAHTRKAQIKTLTLPKAYLELGKEVFLNERFREEFGNLFQRITSVNDQIAKVKASVCEAPQATNLKGKLQSGAANLLAQGKAAQLNMQREALVRELGKKVFETHKALAGSPEKVSAITSALEQITQLDAEINDSSSSRSVPFWQRIPVAALLTIGCFPIGLLLVWLNPRLSRRSKALWIGGFAAFFICMGIIARISIEKARAELAEANQLWRSNDKPAAISKYRILIKDHLHSIPESDRSLIMGRVIDFDAESGNELSVEELLKLADEEHVVPSMSSARARSLNTNWIAERKNAEQSARGASEKSPTPATEQPHAASKATLTVSKGWGSGTFTIEVSPEIQDEIEIIEASIGNTGIITAKVFWKGSIGGRKDPWSYSIYDSDGTQIEGGVVVLPGKVTLGSRFKVDMVVPYKERANLKKVVLHR